MPISTLSRQSDWRHRMKNDPNGPQLRRLDGYISKGTAEMLTTVQDSMNFTKRQTIEFAIQLVLLLQALRGKISDERLADLCFAATANPMRKPRRDGNREEGPEAHEPRPAE
jgi:hypothetical protein